MRPGRYDEVLICHSVKGRFEIEIDGKVQQMQPGDMIWLPEGTSVIYRAVGEAVMFYAVMPVDWMKRILSGNSNRPARRNRTRRIARRNDVRAAVPNGYASKSRRRSCGSCATAGQTSPIRMW